MKSTSFRSITCFRRVIEPFNKIVLTRQKFGLLTMFILFILSQEHMPCDCDTIIHYHG